MKKIIIITSLLAAMTSLSAQNKEVKTIKFHVDGICGMCEERIENALDVKGVKYADWDRNNHLCEVAFRTDKISEEEIHTLLNNAGHDTEKSKASDEAYGNIHECCKYREQEHH